LELRRQQQVLLILEAIVAAESEAAAGSKRLHGLISSSAITISNEGAWDIVGNVLAAGQQ
jgi:hypothetical protein